MEKKTQQANQQAKEASSKTEKEARTPTTSSFNIGTFTFIVNLEENSTTLEERRTDLQQDFTEQPTKEVIQEKPEPKKGISCQKFQFGNPHKPPLRKWEMNQSLQKGSTGARKVGYHTGESLQTAPRNGAAQSNREKISHAHMKQRFLKPTKVTSEWQTLAPKRRRQLHTQMKRNTSLPRWMKQERRCYNCLHKGHIKRYCKNPLKCFSCKQEGHMLRQCKQQVAHAPQPSSPRHASDVTDSPPPSNMRSTGHSTYHMTVNRRGNPARRLVQVWRRKAVKQREAPTDIVASDQPKRTALQPHDSATKDPKDNVMVISSFSGKGEFQIDGIFLGSGIKDLQYSRKIPLVSLSVQMEFFSKNLTFNALSVRALVHTKSGLSLRDFRIMSVASHSILGGKSITVINGSQGESFSVQFQNGVLTFEKWASTFLGLKPNELSLFQDVGITSEGKEGQIGLSKDYGIQTFEEDCQKMDMDAHNIAEKKCKGKSLVSKAPVIRKSQRLLAKNDGTYLSPIQRAQLVQKGSITAEKGARKKRSKLNLEDVSYLKQDSPLTLEQAEVVILTAGVETDEDKVIALLRKVTEGNVSAPDMEGNESVIDGVDVGENEIAG